MTALTTRLVIAFLLLACGPHHVATAQERNLNVQPSTTTQARPEQRVALVIGNSAYKTAPLANPLNDARAMSDALKAAGFSVKLHTDISHRDFLAAIREFGDRLRAGGVGIFYYAGHGMQIKGRNYLIPIDAAIEREDEVAYSAVDAQVILDKMETAGNTTNLMILDACRNNPFARSFRSSTQGLAQMEAPSGTLVAFATAPGSVASDGGSQNGLYTQHLLTALKVPENKVEDVFKQTRTAVRRDSLGKQVPWESTSLEGDFYFFRAAPVVTAPAKIDLGRVEDELWTAVQDSREPSELRAYLKRYPDGRHAGAAKARLLSLVPSTGSQPPPQTTAMSEAQRPQQVFPDPRHDAATRPVLERNLGGYGIGDRWNMQVVDKWKGEVLRNSTKRIEAISDDGRIRFTNADLAAEPYLKLTDGLLAASENGFPAKPGAALWWSDMKVGESRTVNFSTTRRLSNGSVVPTSGSSELNYKGKERVKVPAGEFDAIKLESNGYSDFVAVSGQNGRLRWQMAIWYVPELRYFAAYEVDTRFGTQLDNRFRVELTSYQLQRTRVTPAVSQTTNVVRNYFGLCSCSEYLGKGTVDPMGPFSLEVTMEVHDGVATIVTNKSDRVEQMSGLLVGTNVPDMSGTVKFNNGRPTVSMSYKGSFDEMMNTFSAKGVRKSPEGHVSRECTLVLHRTAQPSPGTTASAR
jgi:hypothetical protein